MGEGGRPASRMVMARRAFSIVRGVEVEVLAMVVRR